MPCFIIGNVHLLRDMAMAVNLACQQQGRQARFKVGRVANEYQPVPEDILPSRIFSTLQKDFGLGRGVRGHRSKEYMIKISAILEYLTVFERARAYRLSKSLIGKEGLPEIHSNGVKKSLMLCHQWQLLSMVDSACKQCVLREVEELRV